MTATAYPIDPAMLTLFCGLLGLAVGSFLNVLIHRLPKMMEREWLAQCAELRTELRAEPHGEAPPAGEPLSLSRPRSHCPACGAAIRPAHNIPVLGYLILRGRCADCGAAISPRYPLVELASGLLSAYAAWRFGPTAVTAGALIFVWVMIALTGIDLDTQLLPDSLTLPLLWLGLAFALQGVFVSLDTAVVGAMAGYLALWSVYWLFKLATGKEGMGYGDFKLLAAIGAWLGWKMLPLVILLSSLVGAAVGIALIVVAGRGRNVPIPFGPYLAAAGLIALFWGPQFGRQFMPYLF